MERYEKDVLNESLDFLCTNVTAHIEIIVVLKGGGWMTADEAESIAGCKTTYLVVNALMEHLMKKKGAMGDLLSALRQKLNGSVADYLEEKLREKYPDFGNLRDANEFHGKSNSSLVSQTVVGKENRTCGRDIKTSNGSGLNRTEKAEGDDDDRSSRVRQSRVIQNIQGDRNVTAGRDITL